MLYLQAMGFCLHEVHSSGVQRGQWMVQICSISAGDLLPDSVHETNLVLFREGNQMSITARLKLCRRIQLSPEQKRSLARRHVSESGTIR